MPYISVVQREKIPEKTGYAPVSERGKGPIQTITQPQVDLSLSKIGGAKTSTPSFLPAIPKKAEVLKMEAFPGAVEKVVEKMGPAPGVYAKVPFMQKEVRLPAGAVSEQLKWAIEYPEQILGTAEEFVTKTLKGEVAEPPKNKPYYVPTIQQEMQDVFQGYIEGKVPWYAVPLEITNAYINLSIAGGIVKTGVKALSRQAIDKAVVDAWDMMGRPIAENLDSETTRLLRKFHPDNYLTGDETKFKLINNASQLLEEKGIPTPTLLQKVGAMAKKLEEPAFTLDYTKKPVVDLEGLLTEKAGYKPIQPFQPFRKPAFGLSIREVPEKPIKATSEAISAEKGIIPPELQPLAQEARKYGSAEEFVKAQQEPFSIARKGYDTVYHETTPQQAKSIIFASGDKSGIYVSPSKELALGQGGNKGAIIEFDTTKIESRGGARPDLNGNPSEFQILKAPSNLQKSVKSVEFAKPLSEKQAWTFEQLKWTKEDLPNGGVKYTNPKAETKSQLTDFYNQAVKGVGEVKPPIPKQKTIIGEEITIKPELEQKGLALGIDKEAMLKKEKGRPLTSEEFKVLKAEEIKATQEGQISMLPEAKAKPPDAFEEYLRKEFGEITPEEESKILSSEFKKEAEVIKKQTERQLFNDIKELGGIKSYRGGFLAEELRPVPLELRNNKTGSGMDEMADMLKAKGYNYSSDTELLEDILAIRREARAFGSRTSVVKTLQRIEKFAPEETAETSTRLLNKLYKLRYSEYRKVFPELPAEYKAARRAIEKGAITEIPKEVQDLVRSPLQKTQERFTKIYEFQRETTNIKPSTIKSLSERYKYALPDDELYHYEEKYAQKRLDKFGGYTSKLVEDLKGAGVREEIINNLKIENKYLKDLVKIKREATGEISATISGDGLDFIKNYKMFKGEPEWFRKFSVANLKKTVGSIIQGYETGMRFFERLGKGYKSLIFDPIRNGERLAVERYWGLREKRLTSVFKMSKKEAEEVWAFSAKKQGKDVVAKTWEELNPKQQKAYSDMLRTAEELYPEVKEVALKNGREIGKVENYTPLYGSDDIIRSGEGGWDWTRKDPYFGSLKERLPEVPIEVYEKDFRKVVDTWAHGVSSYIDIGKRTVPVKYLIESKEFAEITGNGMTKQIQDWYKFLVNPPRVEGVWKGVRGFRGLQAIRILTQPFVVVKQFLNLVDGWVLSSIPDLLKSMKTSVGRNAIAEIAKTSGSIRERGIDLAVQDLQGTVIGWLRTPTTYTDRLTAKTLFVTFFENSLKRAEKSGLELNYKIVRGAKREASDLVDSIMGEMGRAGTPRYWKSETGKALNMFYSQLNSKVQFYLRDVPKKYRKSWAKAIVGLLVGTYLEYSISRMSFTDKPIEMFKENLATLLGNLPFIGSMIFSLTTGQPYYGSPLLSGMSKFLTTLSKGVNEDSIWAGLGLVGVPEEIRKVWQGWQVVEAGGLKTKTGKLTFPVEGLSEQIRTILKGKYGSLAAQEYFKKKEKGIEEETEKGISWESKKKESGINWGETNVTTKPSIEW